MKAQRVILIFSLAMLASFAGAFAYRYVYVQPWDERALGTATSSGTPPSETLTSETLGQKTGEALVGSLRPDFLLGSTTGEQVSASFFDGEVTLVNFWATWCKPCREEMPMLLGLHKAYAPSGFKVVGVAIDDVQQARDFAAGLGVDYPLLVGSTDVMAMARSYGNLSGVLPYSVLIDRAGIVRWTHLGELKEKELTRRIKELLATGT